MFDSDKMWVLLQVIPYPRTDVEWEVISIRLRDCGIDNVSMLKPGNYPVFDPKLLRPCIFFKIPRKQHLFLGGEVFKAGMCGPCREKHVILIKRPCDQLRTIVAKDDGGRNDKCTTEIRLTLYPPESDTEKFKNFQRRKERKTRRCEHWQEVMGRCPKPIKYIFYPLNHILCPNAKGEAAGTHLQNKARLFTLASTRLLGDSIERVIKAIINTKLRGWLYQLK
jgi:hypothetical protein